LNMFENEITKKRKRPGILQYGIPMISSAISR
jgi:hypothetical protein